MGNGWNQDVHKTICLYLTSYVTTQIETWVMIAFPSFPGSQALPGNPCRRLLPPGDLEEAEPPTRHSLAEPGNEECLYLLDWDKMPDLEVA